MSARIIGVVVDAVNAVLDIPAADIEPPPAFGARIRTDFIHGMGKVNGKFVILLECQSRAGARRDRRSFTDLTGRRDSR